MELSVENSQHSPSKSLEKSADADSQLRRRSRPSKRARNWRILFIEDGGDIVSFKSARLLVAGVILVIFTLSGLFAGSLWMYRKAESQRRNLTQRMTDLEREATKLRDEKDRLVARMVLNQSDSQPDDADQSVNADDQAASDVQTDGQERSAEAVQSNLIFPKRVAVKEFEASREADDNALDIRFKLINVGPDRISGYVFAVLKPDSTSSEAWRAAPEVELNDGRPAAHETGQKFSISRYKTMRFRVKDAASYATVFLWIFAEDGALLLKHEAALAQQQ